MLVLASALPKFLASLLETEIRNRDDTELLFRSHRGGYLTLGEVRWVKRALLAVYRSYIEANDDGTADDVAEV